MVIKKINSILTFLDAVIKLGTKNSKTLGFFPKKAFREAASKNNIIGAIENNELLGYLLFDISKKKSHIYIVHLCVEKSQRRRGIASKMFESLVNSTMKTYTYRGIRVHCRRDYEASKLWPKLNFVPMGEKPGRSKHGTLLNIWWYDFNLPDLFSENCENNPKTLIIIDANIFIDLIGPAQKQHKETKYLQSDWLTENIDFYLTKEIFNDIDRIKEDDVRTKTKQIACSFENIKYEVSKFHEYYKLLRPLFPRDMSENDESDLKHLSYSAASKTNIFLTFDRNLLKKADKIFDEVGLRVIRPSVLITDQHYLFREIDYHPKRLSGSSLKFNRINTSNISSLVNKFYLKKYEQKSAFDNLFHACLADPLKMETIQVTDVNNDFFALYCLNRSSSKFLEIPILRIKENNLSSTLSRHIVTNFINIAIRENIELVKITDKKLNVEIIEALQECGFFFDEYWIKLNLAIITDFQKLFSDILPQKIAASDKISCTLINKTILDNNVPTLLKFEKSFFPLKITDLDIPSYIIPIWPFWAMNLFDRKMSEQDLFGGHSHLLLNIENVYYRSSKPKIVNSPARVLWYISSHGKLFHNTQTFCACSYIDEVIIDKPKYLFTKFKGLGVYQWPDILKIAKNDVENDIMAFKFSGTELFRKPIPLNSLRSIWKTIYSKSFQVQTPLKISNDMFFYLYNQGVNYKTE